MASTQDVVLTVHTWPKENSTNAWAPRITCKGAASVDPRDQNQPVGANIEPNMFEWPSDNDGTIGWPLWRDFLKVFLLDRLQPQANH